MELQLNFAMKLTLEEAALRRFVASLWTGVFITVSMEDVPDEAFGNRYLVRCVQREEWRRIAAQVTDIVSALPLPERLKRRMVEVVRPIGAEIREWNVHTQEYLSNSRQYSCPLDTLPEGAGKIDNYTRKYLDARVLEQVCWTGLGTINYPKTAERLVRLEILDVVERFRLACLFCLEDMVRELWKELTEESRGKFYAETSDKTFMEIVTQTQMECYWVCVLKGEESELIDALRGSQTDKNIAFYQRITLMSAHSANKTATEYFFQKLPFDHRDDTLVKAARAVVLKRTYPLSSDGFLNFPEKCRSDILCYLLSVMSPAQQAEVFKEIPHQILTCFMDWPWQDFFMDMADLIRAVHPEIAYPALAGCICYSIRLTGHFIPSFVETYFLCIPVNIRIDFLMEFLSWAHNCSYTESEEAVKVLFRNIPTGIKEEFFVRLVEILHPLMKLRKWRLVDLCVREAAPSRVERKKLKEIIFRNISTDFDSEVLSRLQQSFELPEETEANNSLRSSLYCTIL